MFVKTVAAVVIAMQFFMPVKVAAQNVKSGKPIEKSTRIETLSHKKRYGFTKVSSPTRRGNAAQRFEIRHGDCGKSNGWDDCNSDRGRIERKENPKNKMSNPKSGTWYGYSMLIPKDFKSLGRANTVLGQAKVEKNNMPLWALTFNDSPYLLFSDGTHCKLGPLSAWKGKWVDITIFSHYATQGQPVYFELFKDGRSMCRLTKPIMPQNYANKTQKIGLKYGIYSSFVSRYLDRHKTKQVNNKNYGQTHSNGGKSKSPAQSPFKYDWGVRLPTHVVYYDEMRYGTRREQVDVRMLEKAGASPVD